MIQSSNSPEEGSQTGVSSWKQIVARYQKPSVPRGVWQMVNTLVPYAALWYLMHLSLAVSWWLTVPLAMLAGAFLVRVFIIFHDCGHGSFFKSAAANHILGAITGALTLHALTITGAGNMPFTTPAPGDLDRRGTGDVWTLTVQEYLESSRWKRFAYRLARNPVGAVRAGAVVPVSHQAAGALAQGAVARALLGLLDESGGGGMAAGLIWIFGLKAYLMIQLTVLMVAGLGGGVAVLRAASIRGGLLGTRRGMGLRHGGVARAVRSTNCPRCCNGSPATSGFITFII